MVDILFYLIVFVSNIIQAITGFAGTMIAMPPTILLIGVNEARATLNLFALIVSVFVVCSNFKSIDIKILIRIVAFMGIGLLIGNFINDHVNLDILLTIYGIFILAFGIYKMFSKKELKVNKVVAITILLLAGIMHALFVSGGALLVIYAAQIFDDKNTFRATLSCVWVVLNSVLLIEHVSLQYFSQQVLEYSIFGLIALAFAIVVGNILQKKVSKALFLKISYVLLAINGCTLLF